MRNRNLILILTVLAVAALVAGCGSVRQLTQADNDRLAAIQGKIAKAEQMDARTCAPKELAYAHMQVDAARHEAAQSWEKAPFAPADKAVDVLMKKIQDCEDAKKIPTCNFKGEPEVVAPGKCAVLTWKGENTTKMIFGEEKKNAPDAGASGTKEVCPKETTEYQMTCIGKGGTNYEFVTVKVEAPTAAKPAPAPAPAPAPVVAPAPAPAPVVAPAPAPERKELAIRVNFDTGKHTIRPADLAELQKGVQFIKQNPGAKIAVVGYTDDRGGDKYNQALSQRRADSVRKYLEGEVAIPAENITSEGKGEADPVGDNKTEKGRFENRRVVLTIK